MSETKDLLDDDEKELLMQFINFINDEDFSELPKNEKYQKLLIENFGRYRR